MRWTVLMIALAIVTAAVATVFAAEDRATIKWRTNLEAARTEAAESGRPLMVVFR